MLLLFTHKSRTATLRSGNQAAWASAVLTTYRQYLMAKIVKVFGTDKNCGAEFSKNVADRAQSACLYTMIWPCEVGNLPGLNGQVSPTKWPI